MGRIRNLQRDYDHAAHAFRVYTWAWFMHKNIDKEQEKNGRGGDHWRFAMAHAYVRTKCDIARCHYYLRNPNGRAE